MTSGSNPEQQVIQRHGNDVELKGLGVHMNFMGTFSYHAKCMKQMFDGLARRLCQSHLSPGLSRVFYNSFYIPSAKYSLPVTSMTLRELHQVQSKITACILNALGYNQHYLHAVAFAPSTVFGCGLWDLRVEQGLAQIQSLLDSVGTSHKVGSVMVISLCQLQSEAGVSFDLLRRPQVDVPYLTDCWILSVRQFCARHNISLHLRANRVSSSLRVHDLFLMDYALTLGFKKQELVDLNVARTFLQVTMVSDIASALGDTILQCIWNCTPIPDRKSRLGFARQEHLFDGQRSLWRKLLRSLLVLPASVTKLKLRQPLGAWIAEYNMIWSAATWDSNLYRRDPTSDSCERQVAIHSPKHLINSKNDMLSTTIYDSMPDWYSATVPMLAIPMDIAGEQIFTSQYADVDYPMIPEPASTFQEWLGQLPVAEKRLVSSVSFDSCDAESVLVQYLQVPCQIFIGTDGGLKHHNGSFSWLIYSPAREKLVLNSGPVDGWHKCQSSLRSEATALASVTLYLEEVAVFFDLTIQCQFRLYLDSSSAISNVNQLRDLILKRKYANNADVLSTMRSAHHVIEKFSLQHVKSHQDNTV